MNRLMCLFALIGLMSVGCARVYHKADFPQNKPIAMTSSPGGERQAVLVRHFKERDRQVYFFLFAIPLNNANGASAAERHLNEGDGIANLAIRTTYGPADCFFTLISLGLFPTYTIDTEGDIFTWARPSPPTTLVVPPASGGAVVVPPTNGGTVIVPQSGGSMVTPQGSSVVIPPSSGGTVIVPPARP